MHKQKHGFREFWKTANTILNRGKLWNGSEVVLFLSNKSKLFAINFVSNSTDDKSQSLADFLHLTKHKLYDISVSAREVSSFMKGSDKIYLYWSE